MVKTKPCVVCGKLTKNALFNGSPDEVFICSQPCETQYFESLSADRAARLKSLQYLDEEIRNAIKCERYCWVGATLGFIIILLGVLLTISSPTQEFDVGTWLFMIGLVPLTGGALATKYFSNIREKLLTKKRQLL